MGIEQKISARSNLHTRCQEIPLLSPVNASGQQLRVTRWLSFILKDPHNFFTIQTWAWKADGIGITTSCTLKSLMGEIYLKFPMEEQSQRFIFVPLHPNSFQFTDQITNVKILLVTKQVWVTPYIQGLEKSLSVGFFISLDPPWADPESELHLSPHIHSLQS